jgi:hypothetical protein
MAARFSRQKGDSIFESSLSNAFMYLWLAAHSLGLAAGIADPGVTDVFTTMSRSLPPDMLALLDVGEKTEFAGLARECLERCRARC